MAGETTLCIRGNVTGKPELKYLNSGVAVANFTVAQNSRHFDRKVNDWVDDDPTFLNCTVWRDLAEHVAASLDKGTGVIVYGTLKQRSFETQSGEKRVAYEVDVEDVGPSLRFQVAQVQRSQTSRTQQNNNAAAVKPEEPWLTPTDNSELPF